MSLRRDLLFALERADAKQQLAAIKTRLKIAAPVQNSVSVSPDPAVTAAQRRRALQGLPDSVIAPPNSKHSRLL